MGRRAAIFWHAALSILAGVAYYFAVLARPFELTGEISHGLGTAGRIGCGILVGLAALPVVFHLLRTRRPEFGTPALALNLRTGSIVAHLLAAVLIVGTAVAEIWLSLDAAGQWLFGVYGAAAAIGVLGIFAFELSFVAELASPPKPLKPKKDKRRGRGKTAEGADSQADADTEADAAAAETEPEDRAAVPEAAVPETEAAETEPVAETEGVGDDAAGEADSELGRRRPTICPPPKTPWLSRHREVDCATAAPAVSQPAPGGAGARAAESPQTISAGSRVCSASRNVL